MPETSTQAEGDRMVWRKQFTDAMGVCSETVRLWIKAKKLPVPDVNVSPKVMGWKLSTLRNAGFDLVI